MSVKMNGRKHPAKAIREEIDKLRAEMNEQGTEQPTEQLEAPPEEQVVDELSSKDDFSTNVDEPQSSTVEQEQIPKEQTLEYWKHRFEVIQGKYHAETATLREMVASLKADVEKLQAHPTQPVASVEQILDNLEDEYGQEFSRALNKRIDSIVSQKVSELDVKFGSEINSVRQVQQKNEEQLFQESIGKFVPNWMAINNDPTFISWLGSNQESFSGIDYLTILRNAYSQRDLDKVTKIFQTFTDLSTKTKRPAASAEQQQMIAPPKRGSVSNTIVENNSGKVFTQSEIQDFYRNLNNGAYRGKDEYVRQTKLSILKANSEGRII